MRRRSVDRGEAPIKINARLVIVQQESPHTECNQLLKRSHRIDTECSSSFVLKLNGTDLEHCLAINKFHSPIQSLYSSPSYSSTSSHCQCCSSFSSKQLPHLRYNLCTAKNILTNRRRQHVTCTHVAICLRYTPFLSHIFVASGLSRSPIRRRRRSWLSRWRGAQSSRGLLLSRVLCLSSLYHLQGRRSVLGFN